MLKARASSYRPRMKKKIKTVFKIVLKHLFILAEHKYINTITLISKHNQTSQPVQTNSTKFNAITNKQ